MPAMLRPSVECWITRPVRDSPHVLLLHAPERPGVRPALWQPVSGGIEDGEDPIEACLREVREESGLDLPPEALATVVEDVTLVFNADRALRKFVYAAVAPPGRITLDLREHDAHQWMAADAVAAALTRESHRAMWELAEPIVRTIAASGQSETGSG